MEAIEVCDKRIDYLIDLREEGRLRLEEKTRSGGRELPLRQSPNRYFLGKGEE